MCSLSSLLYHHLWISPLCLSCFLSPSLGGHGGCNGGYGSDGHRGGRGDDGTPGMNATDASDVHITLSGNCAQLGVSGALDTVLDMGGVESESVLFIDAHGGNGGRGGSGGRGQCLPLSQFFCLL